MIGGLRPSFLKGLMDYAKINEQIEAVKKAQVAAELELMAASTARLEAARVENERRRIAAEQALNARTEAILKQRADAKVAQEELERAEQARVRAEEHKQNLAMEAKGREEAEAAALKQRLLDLQHRHDMAMKALKDSFEIAANAELSAYVPVADAQVVPDGTVFKPVTDNVDGTVHPLKQHLFAVNK